MHTQLAYRNYLQGVTWQNIRQKALNHYSYTCQKCYGVGRDVHHLHYPEQWGQETLQDLILLCRKCHNLEHETPKTKEDKTQKIHVRAISSFLSEVETIKIQEQFPNRDLHELFISDTEDGRRARNRALYILNIDEHYGLYDYEFISKDTKTGYLTAKESRRIQNNKNKSAIYNRQAKQKSWQKVLAESNPRLYRKLS